MRALSVEATVISEQYSRACVVFLRTVGPGRSGPLFEYDWECGGWRSPRMHSYEKTCVATNARCSWGMSLFGQLELWTWILGATCVRRLGEGAFRGCPHMRMVRMLESRDGWGCFREFGAVELDLSAAHMKRLVGRMMRSCGSVVRVWLPDGVGEIGCGCFSGAGLVQIGHYLAKVARRAFGECRRGSRVHWPEGLRRWARRASMGPSCW